MSDNVIPFSSDKEETCCPFCQLADEFTLYISDANSLDEVREILRDLVSEASKLGMLEVLLQQISSNAELMDALIYGEETEH